MGISELHISQLGLIAPHVDGLGSARRHFWKGFTQWTCLWSISEGFDACKAF